MTGLVDKVLHGDGDGQAKAQAAAQEASFSDAEAAAYGGVTPKADKAAVQEPSGESCFCTERTQSQEAAGFCAITVTKSRVRLQISARNWASNGCNSGLCGRGVHDRCCLLEHLWNSLRWPAGDAADREPPYSDMAAVAFAGSAPAHHAETAAESAPEAEAAPEAKAAPEADTMPTDDFRVTHAGGCASPGEHSWSEPRAIACISVGVRSRYPIALTASNNQCWQHLS